GPGLLDVAVAGVVRVLGGAVAADGGAYVQFVAGELIAGGDADARGERGADVAAVGARYVGGLAVGVDRDGGGGVVPRPRAGEDGGVRFAGDRVDLDGDGPRRGVV